MVHSLLQIIQVILSVCSLDVSLSSSQIKNQENHLRSLSPLQQLKKWIRDCFSVQRGHEALSYYMGRLGASEYSFSYNIAASLHC